MGDVKDFSFTKVVFHGFIFFSVMFLPTPSLPKNGGGVQRQRCKETYDEAVVSPLLLGEGPGGVGVPECGQGVRALRLRTQDI